MKKPEVLNGLIGMSPAEFERLYSEFELAHLAYVNTLEHTRRDKMKRRRAVGAGRKYKYDLCDRLLMTLFWLRAYTTYKVLGALYNLDKTTIEENLKTVMHTLSLMAGYHFERPQAEVPKLRSMQELIHAFPDMLLILDSETHSIEWHRQKQ